MSGSIRLGEIGGIRVEADYRWFIVLALLTGSLATGRFSDVAPGLPTATYLLTGLVAALLLFASVLAHELGHALVALRLGVPIRSITLFIFGGVAELEREPGTPWAEFKIAAMGPVVSAAIGALAWGAGRALFGWSPLAGDVFVYVGVANLLLAGFNLIPGFPLDGGRVLRAVVWKTGGSRRKATRFAARTGQAFAYLFILLGVREVFGGNLIGGLWMAFVGWFLLSAARAAESQATVEAALRGVRVGDIMLPAPLATPANISVHRLVDDYLLPHGLRMIPVVRSGDLVGVIALGDVRRVPRDHWDEVSVGMAMTPLERLAVADPREAVIEVLPRLVARDVNQLPVVQDGRLVGVLNRDAVMRALEIRRGLPPESDGGRAGPPDQDGGAPMPTDRPTTAGSGA